MLHRFDLYGYQERAIEWVREKPNSALWLDPGLGKSISVLTGFAEMLERFDVRRMLVIAPKRVANRVWSDEIKQWSHLDGLTISVMKGTWQEKFNAMKVPADIHTINRESAAWLAAQFVDGKKILKRFPWDMVVLDESQSFRSQGSQRFKAIKSIRSLFPRCVELTGSPAPGGYHNLWAQYYLLDGGKRLGYSETAFLDRWFDMPQRDDGFSTPRLKEHSKPDIQSAIADITLTLRAQDYLELPKVLVNPIRVALPPAIKAKYKKFAREYVLELARHPKITAVNAGVLHGKLLQLANGAVYVDDRGNYEELHQEKLEALEEALEMTTVRGPVLVAYHFISDLKRMRPVLDKFCGKRKSWRQLKSDASFDEWATGTIDIGVLHPASAGHGLNSVYKSGAQDLIHFGLNPDFELYDQVNKRLTGGHRLVGRNVVIHAILADETQDVDTFALLGRKEANQSDLTAAMAKLATSSR